MYTGIILHNLYIVCVWCMVTGKPIRTLEVTASTVQPTWEFGLYYPRPRVQQAGDIFPCIIIFYSF